MFCSIIIAKLKNNNLITKQYGDFYSIIVAFPALRPASYP